MRSIHKKIFTNCLYSLALLSTVYMMGCSEDPSPDPVGDAVIEGYSPETGASGSELVIRGDHFGNLVSNVKVWVNDVEAEVVSVTPTRIYAIIPKAAGSGTIKVAVGGKEFALASSFTFEYKRNVYTYSGSGAAVSVDGTLRQASFNRPYWLTYDKKDNALFVLEEGRKVRRIKDGQVQTVASLGGSINNPRSITMSISCDTLFIGNDNAGNNSNVTVAILTRDTDFKVQKDYVPSTDATRHVNFAGIHPKDGTLMFYCWPRKLYKWNKQTNSAELLYDLVNAAGITGDYYANFCFSPNGDKLYLVIKYPFIGILQADYNAATKSITGGFQLLAGTGSWGAHDGQGAQASFDQPAQAVVDAKGNIYIAEKFNHWVRMVTPSGAVTRYAGDGGAGNQGFLDGDMLSAKFNEPEGIAFDSEGNIYVADLVNSRIRVIREE